MTHVTPDLPAPEVPTAPRPIRRLLVANRGEIARRVIRTARALGVVTVAVHSPADAGEPFVADADLAVALRGSAPVDSYLDAGQLLEAAGRTGADAIHPGYGFLSESPAFAESVLAAGLTWVGPPPAAMRSMALKSGAKRIVAAAGVPLAPGAELADDAEDDDVLAAGTRVGYPLLVKASAGGGGRGMRLVRSPAGLVEAVRAARAEAAAAFGDPAVLLERFVARGRHVEVQVAADAHGNVVHLFERECSVQRRHQKVLEESPSPGAHPTTLEAMFTAAVATARAIGYVGVGTVEFLVHDDGAQQRFAFLEMNTRLQVEHPVTEEITGIDLVEWQLRIASGEALPVDQAGIRRTGHAIEVRVYAEDPARGHLPGTGVVAAFEVPALPGVRVESGVAAGSRVSPHYDALLAKVIAHGPTRVAAADVLARALAGAVVAGVATNRDALVAVLRSPAFATGRTLTSFLDEHPELADPPVDPHELARDLAAVALGSAERARACAPWGSLAPAGWRNVTGVPETCVLGVHLSGLERRVEVRSAWYRDRVDVAFSWQPDHPSRSAGPAPAEGDDPVAQPPALADLRVTGAVLRDDVLALTAAGITTRCRLRVAPPWAVVTAAGASRAVRLLPRFPEPTATDRDHGSAAPVPGTVTRVAVAVGDRVGRGEVLVVLESMKMEHPVRSGVDGIVVAVRARVGDSVEAGQVVAVVDDV